MALTLEGLFALFNAHKSELDILKARVDELEKDALLTEADLAHTRDELTALKAECAPILAMMEMTNVGRAAAVAPMPVAAVAPMPVAAVAPMPVAAVAPMSTPTTILKITLLKEVDLPTFLPELHGMTIRSELKGENKAGGYIWLNFLSMEQATLAYEQLRHSADPAYKVVYKQAKAK